MHDRSSLGRIDTPDLHNRDSYTISDLSDEFGVTARALRFYEDEGLIAPERKGLTRVYSKRDRARLAWIMRAKNVGFSLGEIREMIDLYDVGDGTARTAPRHAAAVQGADRADAKAEKGSRKLDPGAFAVREDGRAGRQRRPGLTRRPTATALRAVADTDHARLAARTADANFATDCAGLIPPCFEKDINMPKYTAPVRDTQFILTEVLGHREIRQPSRLRQCRARRAVGRAGRSRQVRRGSAVPAQPGRRPAGLHPPCRWHRDDARWLQGCL